MEQNNSIEKVNTSSSLIKRSTPVVVTAVAFAAIASWGVFTTPPGTSGTCVTPASFD